MKMNGTRLLPAPQQQVWEKLNDVETLKRCIPGCQTLEQVGDNQLKATVGLKIGPVNAKFNGQVELTDMNPPDSYRISGSGKGGPAGSASGGANIRLEPAEGGTLLTYDVDAKVAGKIAQLGARLIDGTAASLAEKFFDNFAAELEPAVSENQGVGEAMQAAADAATATDGLTRNQIIFGAAVIGVMIIYYLLSP
ncbi:MAG: carbon monoxide dehydrogenase subunit G [Hyphomicrobiaceae bacterium]|jgi:carbon monoxide dehydrogenase subunit G